MGASARATLLAVCCASCASGGAERTPRSPAAPSATEQPSTASPVSATAGARLPPTLSSVPAPPASCAAFSVPADGVSPACASPEQAREALAVALELEDAAVQTRRLAELEACDVWPVAVIRALRAELVPEGCADLLIDPTALAGAARPRKDVEDALLGLVTAARLTRLVRRAPRFEPPYDKQRFNAFFSERLGPWIRSEAHAIEQLSAFGAQLTGYGRGVAAIAAGLADMRFVEVARAVHLPDELKGDDEVASTYYAALDQALEPRKTRGRDAALAGLREFALEGVLRDARLDEAHALLSTLYAGRRIDALQKLLLPPRPPVRPKTVEQRLASALPTFYAGLLLAHVDARQPEYLAAIRERGIPRAVRAALDAAALAGSARDTYVRALLELGQRYWRAEDFRRAGELARAPADGGSDERRFAAAIAQALQNGPRDAREMMLAGAFAHGPPDVSALDALVETDDASRGMAAYDAAHLLSLAPPRESSPAFFAELGRRYRAAAKRLRDPAQQRLALEQAKAAEQTARAVR